MACVRERVKDSGKSLRISWCVVDIYSSICVSYGFITPSSLFVQEYENSDAASKYVFDCLKCGKESKPEDLYVLERCGHFFCTPCLFQHARRHLKEYREHRLEMQQIKQEIEDVSSL